MQAEIYPILHSFCKNLLLPAETIVLIVSAGAGKHQNHFASIGNLIPESPQPVSSCTAAAARRIPSFRSGSPLRQYQAVFVPSVV